MADDLENPGQWRDAVETRLGTLETKVGEEARLRAAMDEDLSRLHVERNLLQALHDTQSDHTATLRDHTAILGEHTATLREHTVILGEHTAILGDHTVQLADLRGTLQQVHVGIQLISGKLDTLIDRDDA